MSGKLRDYQVIDVLSDGTLYKVKHKVTNKIFTWKAYNCSEYSDEKIYNVTNEVKILSKALSDTFLHYYDSILHGPTKTLYFVLEYTSWQSLQDLADVCKATDKHFIESYLWYLLLNLARVCKTVEGLKLVALKKCIKPEAIFIGPNGQIRINCFELCINPSESTDMIKQVGKLLHSLCYPRGVCDDKKIVQFWYSEDLSNVIDFLTSEKNHELRPEVILYHPTVLTNTETLIEYYHITNILVSDGFSHSTTGVNKCDSEKAVDLCNNIEPLPEIRFDNVDSPIYYNIKPKQYQIEQENYNNDSLSPTIAALALELPGYVPRSRKPYSEAVANLNGPQRITEETLSHQWMSRLIALRHREESLNQRERDILAKEIIKIPSTKVLVLKDTLETNSESNGITLPEVITQGKNNWVSRRRLRSSSVRKPRRKSYAYEDLDSSLSADNGDSSMIITATKITKENMPQNIFPHLATKKVHFTSNNPFAESDDSVTLTYYEVDNVKKESQSNVHKLNDISKFKYLEDGKVASEKRTAKHWNLSSPSKQAKITEVFSNATNREGLRKTPSKASLTSKSSKQSCSQWSIDSGQVSGSDQTCLSLKSFTQTPKAPPEFKRTKSRKSLIPFKTPFKFMSSSTKV